MLCIGQYIACLTRIISDSPCRADDGILGALEDNHFATRNPTIHNGPKNESPDHMTRFVQSVFAIGGYVANEWPGFDAYLNILKEQAQHFEIDGFVAFRRFLGSSSPPNFEATLKFLTVVASIWRVTERSDLSIDERWLLYWSGTRLTTDI